MAYLQRGIYWILNSLIIFSVGIGAAANIDTLPQRPQTTVDVHNSASPDALGSLSLVFMPISTAHAREDDSRSDHLLYNAPRVERPAPRTSRDDFSVPETYGTSQGMNLQERQQEEYLRTLEAYKRRWSW